MDKESASAAQKKANAIIPKVGYPLNPDTTKPESIKNWYARVDIAKDDFFGNVLRSELVDNARTWGSLGRQRNRDSWEMYPQTVNAYYSPPDGEIVFPAGILQPPFYSISWPQSLRYGAFGAVAAHELTHAFDNAGAQYDEKGRLRDWWTNKTVEAFTERAQCVAKQYSKYYVLDADGKKVYVNGNVSYIALGLLLTLSSPTAKTLPTRASPRLTRPGRSRTTPPPPSPASRTRPSSSSSSASPVSGPSSLVPPPPSRACAPTPTRRPTGAQSAHCATSPRSTRRLAARLARA
jgi:hypothetical protein